MSHPLPNMLETTMEKIKNMVNVNSVIGDPITTPDGVTIIPVSKISYGFGGGFEMPYLTFQLLVTHKLVCFFSVEVLFPHAVVTVYYFDITAAQRQYMVGAFVKQITVV